MSGERASLRRRRSSAIARMRGRAASRVDGRGRSACCSTSSTTRSTPRSWTGSMLLRPRPATACCSVLQVAGRVASGWLSTRSSSFAPTVRSSSARGFRPPRSRRPRRCRSSLSPEARGRRRSTRSRTTSSTARGWWSSTLSGSGIARSRTSTAERRRRGGAALGLRGGDARCAAGARDPHRPR